MPTPRVYPTEPHEIRIWAVERILKSFAYAAFDAEEIATICRMAGALVDFVTKDALGGEG